MEAQAWFRHDSHYLVDFEFIKTDFISKIKNFIIVTYNLFFQYSRSPFLRKLSLMMSVLPTLFSGLGSIDHNNSHRTIPLYNGGTLGLERIEDNDS